jgi:hypothetical protein
MHDEDMGPISIRGKFLSVVYGSGRIGRTAFASALFQLTFVAVVFAVVIYTKDTLFRGIGMGKENLFLPPTGPCTRAPGAKVCTMDMASW